VGQHSSASGSRLLGLDGFQVVSAELQGGEWQLVVQTTATVVGCAGCGVRATPHGRRTVRVRDLPIGGRPVVLCWRKRLWRCREPACQVRTWTERVAAIGPRAVLTQRARAEACRRVGTDAHAVAAVARDLGVGWATIMRAVRDHGTPLLEDPTRLDGVTTLGLDETSFHEGHPPSADPVGHRPGRPGGWPAAGGGGRPHQGRGGRLAWCSDP
jgi:transposase